ncbi:hypothetical protein QTP88_002177 [Uroleucon formosanum]
MDENQTLKFIESYKTAKLLWDANHTDYCNKIKRNYALERIGNGFNIDVSAVKIKIKNLRSYFSKERQKSLNRKSGSGADETYVSSWFTYAPLLFVADSSTTRETNATETDTLAENTDIEYTQSFSSPSSAIPSPNLIKKSSKSFISKKREFMDIASETIKSLSAPMKEDDEYDIIGKRFAMQLRSMKDKQMFLAEKIIGDVMYYGRMEKLTENCFKFKNTNISTTEPQVNITSMSQSQNNIIRPTFHSQNQHYLRNIFTINNVNICWKILTLLNYKAHIFSTMFLHTNKIQITQQYSYEDMPTDQYRNHVNRDMNTSSINDNVE